MKIALIGSRNLIVKDLGRYLPENVTEIVSGGARGIDAVQENMPKLTALSLRNFCPNMKSTAGVRRSNATCRLSTTPT